MTEGYLLPDDEAIYPFRIRAIIRMSNSEWIAVLTSAIEMLVAGEGRTPREAVLSAAKKSQRSQEITDE